MSIQMWGYLVGYVDKLTQTTPLSLKNARPGVLRLSSRSTHCPSHYLEAYAWDMLFRGIHVGKVRPLNPDKLTPTRFSFPDVSVDTHWVI